MTNDPRSSINLNPKTWVDEHGDFLLNYCMARVYAKELAEDLVQETFLSAYQARDSFQARSSERTWLVSILRRKIVDHYRSKEKDREQSTDPFKMPFSDAGMWNGHWKEERAPGNWLKDKIEGEEEATFIKILQHCLSLLPARVKACFTLKTLEEYPSEKICKELDITPSNLWVMLHRARLQLRECIEKKWR